MAEEPKSDPVKETLDSVVELLKAEHQSIDATIQLPVPKSSEYVLVVRDRSLAEIMKSAYPDEPADAFAHIRIKQLDGIYIVSEKYLFGGFGGFEGVDGRSTPIKKTRMKPSDEVKVIAEKFLEHVLGQIEHKTDLDGDYSSSTVRTSGFFRELSQVEQSIIANIRYYEQIGRSNAGQVR